MTPASVMERLTEHPALGRLSDADREELVGAFELLTFEPGAVLIEEGAVDRDLYLIVDGQVQMRRGDLSLGLALPGELLGELALVEPRPRSASVVADTQVTAARLGLETFEQIAQDDPALALRLTQLFIRGLGKRLRSLTDDIGSLLHERSLPRRRHIQVRVDGKARWVRTGISAGELLPVEVDGAAVVAALMNRRAVSLTAPLTADCTVEPLTTAHWEGRRVARQSLGLLLLEAAARAAPYVDLELDHSIGVGRRVRIDGPHDADLASLVETEMRRLVAADLPLHEEWWTRDEAAAYFDAVGQPRTAQLLRTRHQPTVRLATYGDVFSLDTGPLVPQTGRLGDFDVLADNGDLVLVYGRAATGEGTPKDQDREAVARKRARDARRVAANAAMLRTDSDWLGALDVHSVGEFNHRCIDGSVNEIIHVSEGAQEKRLGRIADAIAARGDTVRVVCIAGPSSSGKTTFIRRLKVQLQVDAFRPIGLSLDDYFKDREDTPRDEDGEYDFESFGALRSDLLEEHLERLLAGERVKTARFDFLDGRSVPDGGREITLRHDQILMIEGIHGLNPRLLSNLPDAAVYRIFVCPLQQLPLDAVSRVHASDVRLLRRIVRDRHSRGHAAADTIARWPSVRCGERRNIFPFVAHADAAFDSSLVYELSVLKVFAQRYLLEVPSGHPATVTAQRLLALLDDVVTLYPDHVPATSILREFIGGSGFEY